MTVVDNRLVREIKGRERERRRRRREGHKDLSQGLEREKRREGLLLVEGVVRVKEREREEEVKLKLSGSSGGRINSGGGGVCWQTITE